MQGLDKNEIYSLDGLNDEQLIELAKKTYLLSCLEELKEANYIRYWNSWRFGYGMNTTAKAIDLFKQEIKKGQIWQHIKTGERVEVDSVSDDGIIFFKCGAYFDDVNHFSMFWELVEEEAKPSQYQIGIDTFARCEANLTKEEILACCKFNIDKYNWRQKNQDKQDLEKIIHYAQWALKQLK